MNAAPFRIMHGKAPFSLESTPRPFSVRDHASFGCFFQDEALDGTHCALHLSAAFAYPQYIGYGYSACLTCHYSNA